jgi:Mrp family chromosome partitioning ATPase
VSVIVITGLPGTGKTELSFACAAAFMAAGVSTLVLHTDLLKVTTRALGLGPPSGPATGEDWAARAKVLRPLLEQHVRKAARDGYLLLIEGTLAAGCSDLAELCVLITLDEELRAQRLDRKPPVARAALAATDWRPLAQSLKQQTTQGSWLLDGALPVGPSARAVVEEWTRRHGAVPPHDCRSLLDR